MWRSVCPRARPPPPSDVAAPRDTTRCRWFGIFILWTRLLETSVLVFMPSKMQLVFAVCVSLLYVVVLREVRTSL